MNILKLTKKTSSIFLAVILVLGTIAVSYPSFMVGDVQAQPEYGMDKIYNSYESEYGKDSYDKKPYENNYGQESYGKDRDYDKSKDSRSDLLKTLKCNNINANINNVDANFGSLPVEEGDTNGANGEALAAQGGESISANGLMNGGSDSDRSFVDRENDFTFVCINNNNNTVIEEQPLEIVTCEECFGANNTLREIVEDALVDQTATVSYIVSLDNNEGDTLTIPGNVDTIEQLCPLLEGHSDVLVASIISSFLAVNPQTPESGIDALIECLLEAGIIVDRDFPPPLEICDNGIDDDEDGLTDCEDPDCIGDPVCEPQP